MPNPVSDSNSHGSTQFAGSAGGPGAVHNATPDVWSAIYPSLFSNISIWALDRSILYAVQVAWCSGLSLHTEYCLAAAERRVRFFYLIEDTSWRCRFRSWGCPSISQNSLYHPMRNICHENGGYVTFEGTACAVTVNTISCPWQGDTQCTRDITNKLAERAHQNTLWNTALIYD